MKTSATESQLAFQEMILIFKMMDVLYFLTTVEIVDSNYFFILISFFWHGLKFYTIPVALEQSKGSDW